MCQQQESQSDRLRFYLRRAQMTPSQAMGLYQSACLSINPVEASEIGPRKVLLTSWDEQTWDQPIHNTLRKGLSPQLQSRTGRAPRLQLEANPGRWTQTDSVRDHRVGTSCSRRVSSTYWYRLRRILATIRCQFAKKETNTESNAGSKEGIQYIYYS